MEKLVPNPFLKKEKTEHTSGWRVWSFIQFIFIAFLSRVLPNYIETKVLTTCFYLIQSFFYKTKRSMELVSLPQFLHNFWRKMFLSCFINWPNFLSNCLYFFRYLAIRSVIVWVPVCDVIHFEINLFLSNRFPTEPKKSGLKIKYLKNEKSF